MGQISKNLFLHSLDKLAKARDNSFVFYHYAPKDVDTLMSPEYVYSVLQDKDLYRKMTEKYRSRLTGAWNIYPGRDPDSLTDEEVYAGLEKIRGKGGNNRIYFFRYMPYAALGPRMRAFLKARKAFELNLDDPEVRKKIKNIDWGREGSSPDGKTLDEAYYRKVSKKDYFKNYDDSAQLNFAALNHIAVEPRTKLPIN